MTERRAYICLKCDPPVRTFAAKDEKEPRCSTHGKMTRQANLPYTRPEPGKLPRKVPAGRSAQRAGRQRGPA